MRRGAPFVYKNPRNRAAGWGNNMRRWYATLLVALTAAAVYTTGGDSALSRSFLPGTMIQGDFDGFLFDIVGHGSHVEVQYFHDDDYYSRTSNDYGMSFGPAQNITDFVENRYPESNAFAEYVSNGGIYQVWVPVTNDGLLFRRSTDGGTTWEPTVTIAGMAVESPNFSAEGENIWIGWKETAPGTNAFMRRSMDGGQTFDPAMDIGDALSFGSGTLPNGDLLVTFVNRLEVTIHTYPSGDLTSTPFVTQYTAPPGPYFFDLTFGFLAINPAGIPIVGWDWVYDGEGEFQFATSHDNGQTWQRTVLGDNEGEILSFFGMAFASDTWWVVWEYADGHSEAFNTYAQTFSNNGQAEGPIYDVSDGDPPNFANQIASLGDQAFLAFLEDIGGGNRAAVVTTLTPGQEPSRDRINLNTDFANDFNLAGFENGSTAAVAGVADATGQMMVQPTGSDGDGALYMTWSDDDDLHIVPIWLAGDADCDHDVDTADVVATLADVAGLSEAECGAAADINCDDELGLEDALALLYDRAGLPPMFDAEYCPSVGT